MNRKSEYRKAGVICSCNMVPLFIWNCCMGSREMEVEEYEHYDAPKCYPKVFCNLFLGAFSVFRVK